MTGSHLKHRLGGALTPLLNVVARLSGRRSGVVLLYHTIEERQGDPQRELVPPVAAEQFARQLRHLRRNYAIVRLDELPSAVAKRRRGGRFPVAITFDDDATQHRRYALPILDREQVVATFFVGGRGLHADLAGSPWWDRLQRAFDRGHGEAAVAGVLRRAAVAAAAGGPPSIHAAAVAFEDLPGDERVRAAERLLHWAGEDPPRACLSRDDLRALSEGGHTIGFHTLRHEQLPGLDDDELERALTDGLDQLQAVSGRSIDLIAYPHGKVDGRVATAARDAGFRFGVTTISGAVTPQADPLRLARVEPARYASPELRSDGTFAYRVLRTILTP